MKPNTLELLHPVGFSEQEHQKVQFEIEPVKKELHVCFEIKSASPFHVNHSISTTEPSWGLWNYDVVEVFVQPDQSSPTYYEFVVSPLGQFFELQIFTPRVNTNKNFRSGFQFEVQTTEEGFWKTQFKIPLEKLGWKGDLKSVKANAFAILGKNPRLYYSLFLPVQEKPDFHRPEFFKPVLVF